MQNQVMQIKVLSFTGISQVFCSYFTSFLRVTIIDNDRKAQGNAEKWQLIPLISAAQESFILGACISEFHSFHSPGKIWLAMASPGKSHLPD